MKGIILTSFVGWVEQTRGLVTCDQMLTKAADQLSTGGAYTTVGNYPASELRSLAEALAEIEGTSSDVVMREFGTAAFAQLGALHPEWIAQMPDLMSMLGKIESIIHVEVRKLYPESMPPLIRARQDDDGTIAVTYDSHRDLVALCQGLLQGAAAHYGDERAVELISERSTAEGTHAEFRIRPGQHA
jgi:hypothetical protein